MGDSRFEIKVRRLPGDAQLFAVRFSTMRGRGVLTLEPMATVQDSLLRTNGFLTDLTRETLLNGQFIYVGESVDLNGKYRLWDREPDALDLLKPGVWESIAHCVVAEDPFFILDTDTFDFPLHWRPTAEKHSIDNLSSVDTIDAFDSIQPDALESLPPDPDPNAFDTVQESAFSISGSAMDSSWVVAIPDDPDEVEALKAELEREKQARMRLEAEVARLRKLLDKLLKSRN